MQRELRVRRAVVRRGQSEAVAIVVLTLVLVAASLIALGAALKLLEHQSPPHPSRRGPAVVAWYLDLSRCVLNATLYSPTRWSGCLAIVFPGGGALCVRASVGPGLSTVEIGGVCSPPERVLALANCPQICGG